MSKTKAELLVEIEGLKSENMCLSKQVDFWMGEGPTPDWPPEEEEYHQLAQVGPDSRTPEEGERLLELARIITWKKDERIQYDRAEDARYMLLEEIPGKYKERVETLLERLYGGRDDVYKFSRSMADIPTGLDDYEPIAREVIATAQIAAEKIRAEFCDLINLLLTMQWLFEEEKRAEQYVKRCMEEDEIHYWHIQESGFAVKRLVSLVHYYKQQYHSTESNFAAVVEHAAITLRAIEMLTRLNRGTHRMRDGITESTVLACQEGIDELLHLREQGIDALGWGHFSGRSFEFRRVAQRNNFLENANNQLVERNKKLEGEKRSANSKLEGLKTEIATQGSNRQSGVPEKSGQRSPF